MVAMWSASLYWAVSNSASSSCSHSLDMKDTIIVTSCGAESIAFLKFYGVLPGSALFFLWYSWLSNRLGREALWNATAFPFFAFFAAFGFIIYPALAQSSLLNDATPSASDRVGALTNATCLLLHWRFALFYVAAELYSSVSISILFWQFMNDVVPVDRAPFFYPLFGQVSSLAPIVAGEYVQHFSAKKGADMETNIRRVMGAVSICGLGLVCLQRYYSWRFLSEEENNNMIDVAKVLVAPETLRKATSEEEKERTTKTKKSKKAKMSMIESMRFLLQSEYLGCLAVLVLSYGLSIQFTDIMWKNMVKKLYPSKLEYTLYIATFSSRVGALTFVSIFFGSNIVKRLGWHGGAVTPPAVMCSLSLPFFYLILTGSADLEGSGLEAVFIGAVQSMFCNGQEYPFRSHHPNGVHAAR